MQEQASSAKQRGSAHCCAFSLISIDFAHSTSAQHEFERYQQPSHLQQQMPYMPAA
jgi:hypothetical protein